MSEERKPAICYIVQENRNAPLYLSVMDQENGQYHMFPLSVNGAARLGYECSAAVHLAISGHSLTHSFREVAAVLQKLWRGK